MARGMTKYILSMFQITSTIWKTLLQLIIYLLLKFHENGGRFSVMLLSKKNINEAYQWSLIFFCQGDRQNGGIIVRLCLRQNSKVAEMTVKLRVTIILITIITNFLTIGQSRNFHFSTSHSAWSESRNTRRSDGVRTGSSIARTNLASATGCPAVTGDSEATRDETRSKRAATCHCRQDRN